jgi:hypothetical protein
LLYYFLFRLQSLFCRLLLLGVLVFLGFFFLLHFFLRLGFRG